jgi:hypothetical protein
VPRVSWAHTTQEATSVTINDRTVPVEYEPFGAGHTLKVRRGKVNQRAAFG